MDSSNNENNISPNEAAELLGKTVQFVRCGLKAKILPFGTAVEMPGGRWSFHISRIALNEYLAKGVPICYSEACKTKRSAYGCL